MAVVLARHHHVWAVDLNPRRVDLVNQRVSPLVDTELSDYLTHRQLDLHPTTDGTASHAGASFVVVATPTDYDPEAHHFDPTSVGSVI